MTDEQCFCTSQKHCEGILQKISEVLAHCGNRDPVRTASRNPSKQAADGVADTRFWGLFSLKRVTFDVSLND